MSGKIAFKKEGASPKPRRLSVVRLARVGFILPTRAAEEEL